MRIREVFLAAVMLGTIGVSLAGAQKVVDKVVATVSDGFRTELISLSDLRWRLVLQTPAKPEPHTSDELNAALQILIERRIFALEAARLPRNPVSKAEIDAEINQIMSGISAAAFESRLRQVGFSSVSDERFQRIIEERLAIEKFLDFRFRTFIVITPQDEEKHYRDVFVPDFRRRFPGLLMPTLDEKRKEINTQLVELRVAADMQTYLEAARQRMTVAIVNPV